MEMVQSLLWHDRKELFRKPADSPVSAKKIPLEHHCLNISVSHRTGATYILCDNNNNGTDDVLPLHWVTPMTVEEVAAFPASSSVGERWKEQGPQHQMHATTMELESMTVKGKTLTGLIVVGFNSGLVRLLETQGKRCQGISNLC